MEKIVSTLVDYIWGNGLVYLSLAVVLYFYISTNVHIYTQRVYFLLIRILKTNHTIINLDF